MKRRIDNPYKEMVRVLRRYDIDVDYWEAREERPLGMRAWYELLRDRVDPVELHHGLRTLSHSFFEERFAPLDSDLRLSQIKLLEQAVAVAPKLPREEDVATLMVAIESQRQEAERLVGGGLGSAWWGTWATLAEITDLDAIKAHLYEVARELHPCDALTTDRDVVRRKSELAVLPTLREIVPESYTSIAKNFRASEGMAISEPLSSEGTLRSLSADPGLAIAMGDFLVDIGDSLAGLEAYELAVHAAPNRKIQSEVGYLLLQRARVDRLPFCEDDFAGEVVQFGGGAEFCPAGEIIREASEGPEFPSPSDLIAVAVKAFGAAWSDGNTYGPRSWGRSIVLDGLRAAFVALEDWDSAEAVCDAAFELEDWGWEWERFEPWFMETKAYIRGRRTTTKRKHAEYERRFKSQFDFLHRHLCAEATRLVVDGEILRSQLPMTDKPDWAVCVSQYCRGLEAELRAGIGRALELAGIPLPHRRAVMTIADFAKTLEVPLASAALASIAPDLRVDLDGLAVVLDSIARLFRNPASHAGPPMGAENALKLRHRLLEDRDEGGWGILRLLAEFSARRADRSGEADSST